MDELKDVVTEQKMESELEHAVNIVETPADTMEVSMGAEVNTGVVTGQRLPDVRPKIRITKAPGGDKSKLNTRPQTINLTQEKSTISDDLIEDRPPAITPNSMSEPFSVTLTDSMTDSMLENLTRINVANIAERIERMNEESPDPMLSEGAACAGSEDGIPASSSDGSVCELLSECSIPDLPSSEETSSGRVSSICSSPTLDEMSLEINTLEAALNCPLAIPVEEVCPTGALPPIPMVSRATSP